MISTKTADRRQWLYLALLAAAVFFLFPQVIGFPHAIRILRNAQPLFLALALFAETSRYLTSAASTYVLARLFRRTVPFEPLTEAFFAGSALNRAFSTAGAPGMVVRYLFLLRNQVSSGNVAVIYVIEDMAGLVIGGLIFLIGVVALAAAPSTTTFMLILAIGFPIGSLSLALAALALYRRRAWVERSIHWLARGFDSLARWLINRPVYERDRVQEAIDQFYAGMTTARRAPSYALASFGFNLLRYAAGIAAVYFSFHALGWTISPGLLILFYTSASVLSAISAVPGELAILGGSWAILTLSFGVPKEIAIMALLISRTIAFWLPLPVGFLALWNLRRQRYL